MGWLLLSAHILSSAIYFPASEVLDSAQSYFTFVDLFIYFLFFCYILTSIQQRQQQQEGD